MEVFLDGPILALETVDLGGEDLDPFGVILVLVDLLFQDFGLVLVLGHQMNQLLQLITHEHDPK